MNALYVEPNVVEFVPYTGPANDSDEYKAAVKEASRFQKLDQRLEAQR